MKFLKRQKTLYVQQWSQPVPKVQWQPALIQNTFTEILIFSSNSEGFQNQLWSDFWIYLNQSKNSVKLFCILLHQKIIQNKSLD